MQQTGLLMCIAVYLFVPRSMPYTQWHVLSCVMCCARILSWCEKRIRCGCFCLRGRCLTMPCFILHSMMCSCALLSSVALFGCFLMLQCFGSGAVGYSHL
jgi:hypothetical protein